jgi:hypothetical protein
MNASMVPVAVPVASRRRLRSGSSGVAHRPVAPTTVLRLRGAL